MAFFSFGWLNPFQGKRDAGRKPFWRANKNTPFGKSRHLMLENLERRELLAILYWDTNGSAPGLGGAGTWDQSTSNWSPSPAGDVATQTWVDGSEAVFGGTGGTVAVSGQVSPASIGFESTGYTIQGGGIALATGGHSVVVASGLSATISSSISGVGSLGKSGDGTLTLSGNNTFSGGSSLDAGTLTVAHNAGLGTGTITLNGGSLQSSGSRTLANAVTAASGTLSTLISPSGSNLTLNGNLSGTGTIYKTGAYSVYLGGDNSGFSGTFSNRQSNLYFNVATAGSAAAAWDMTGGGQLGMSFNGDAIVSLGSLSGNSGQVHGGYQKTGTKTLQIGALNANSTYSGI